MPIHDDIGRKDSDFVRGKFGQMSGAIDELDASRTSLRLVDGRGAVERNVRDVLCLVDSDLIAGQAA